MRFLAASAFLFLAGCLAGCATVAPPEPTSVRHGLLFFQARVKGAILWFTSDLPDRAVVEQLDAAGQPVPGRLISSNLARSGRLYVLDVPPGKYALSTLSFPARGARYEVALSSAVMRKAAVEVRPGAAAFMGALTLEGVFPEFDVAVDRAVTVVGHWLTPFLARPVLPRDAALREHDLGRPAEQAALYDARRDLSAMQWPLAIETRLREIGAPEPAAMSGGLRPKVIPLRDEGLFSWRDTLEWGEPARSRAGLAWHRPGGEARVAVFFTTATAPGFVGFDEAVRRMRAASGGLEDRAAVYEVRVATRTGMGARVTSHQYKEGTLVGSEESVTVTETILVPDPYGLFTFRLRAPRGEFERVLPDFRNFLLQLFLGPQPKVEVKQEPVLPL